MSEKNNGEFQTNIERKNIRFTAKIGKQALVFDYYNSLLCEFPEPYDHMKHVYKTGKGEGRATYYFAAEYPELYEGLDQNNFPKTVQPYPSPTDEQMFGRYFDATLSRDLDTFLEAKDEE